MSTPRGKFGCRARGHMVRPSAPRVRAAGRHRDGGGAPAPASPLARRGWARWRSGAAVRVGISRFFADGRRRAPGTGPRGTASAAKRNGADRPSREAHRSSSAASREMRTAQRAIGPTSKTYGRDLGAIAPTGASLGRCPRHDLAFACAVKPAAAGQAHPRRIPILRDPTFRSPRLPSRCCRGNPLAPVSDHARCARLRKARGTRQAPY